MTEAEKEKQHQEDLQRLRGFRLIDDDFMNACFDGYTDGAQLLLRIILNKPDIYVKSVKTQKWMKNLIGRDIYPDDMHYKELADKVRYFKEDEKGVAAMCKVMEDMRKESKWEQIVASVRRWLSMGLTHEQIAQGEGITIDQVREIAGMD